jgi:predicted small secreted protein
MIFILGVLIGIVATIIILMIYISRQLKKIDIKKLVKELQKAEL